MVRHGEASHNTYKFYQKIYSHFLFTDTGLTESGEDQARRSGNELKSINFNYVFSSDLQRTYQTAQNILDTMGYREKPVIILPCAHELTATYNEKDNTNSDISHCDSTQIGHDVRNTVVNTVGTAENRLSLKGIADSTGIENGRIIVSDSYKQKYGDSGRSRILNRKTCNNTNMIKEAINYINNRYIIYYVINNDQHIEYINSYRAELVNRRNKSVSVISKVIITINKTNINIKILDNNGIEHVLEPVSNYDNLINELISNRKKKI